MSYSREADGAIWAAIGPDSLLEALVPLREAHGRRGDDCFLIPGHSRDIARVAAGFPQRRASLLIAEDPSRPSDRARFDSPFLQGDAHGEVLLGWTRLDAGALGDYARRAAVLLQRSPDAPQADVLLAPRDRRYLDLLDELEGVAGGGGGDPPIRWSAERLRRQPLLRALRLGAGAVIYTGHGHPGGWLAYGGITPRLLAADGDWLAEQAAALLCSLSCRTGEAADPLDTSSTGRPSTGASAFADRLIAHGVAGTVLAPLGRPLHAGNRQLARALVCGLGLGKRCVQELLAHARVMGAPLQGYAVIGDPALPALASSGAAARAARVFAPAADECPCTRRQFDSLEHVARNHRPPSPTSPT